MKFFRNSEAVIGVILIAAMLLIGAVNPAFWDLDNLFSLLQSNIVIGIMALGVLLVMISGGIDVSFPAVAVAGMFLTVHGMLLTQYDGVLLPFVVATLIGVLLGAFNALLVYRFKMIPLIVTLGTASIVRGLILGVIGTSMINIDRFPKVLINFTKSDIYTVVKPDGTTSGMTSMLLIYLGVALLIHIILKYTMLGRSVYAMGGSAESASRVGFSLKKTTFFVYCACGALAGFAGMLHSSMIWLCNPRDFVGMDMQVIAAVVLGGASIFGGSGSVIGTMMGVFMLVMVKNSLILMKVETTWQLVVLGTILIVATAFSAKRDRKSRT
ncbi:ABC transporter permease [Rhodoferax sp. BLA1]|uniref:ABC transporter permease n=1 Tax=Rhodoferax sp. BLA1 TaxID=2576062 RepID=UPI0015D1A67B|nr:ABC transporter permease [Rhodoferax sp. BLA1]